VDVRERVTVCAVLVTVLLICQGFHHSTGSLTEFNHYNSNSNMAVRLA